MIRRIRLLFTLAPALLLPGLAASATKTDVKLMLRDTPQVEALRAAGRLQVLDRYSAGGGAPGWLLVRGDETLLAAAAPGAVTPSNSRRVDDKVFLRARTIDTSTPSTGALRGGGAGRLEIIQFHGPIKKEWLKTIRSQGRVRPIAYLPENAYLVWVDRSEERRVGKECRL